ncbi:hypothetical protein KUTeg_018455 [Tegillarca granosa]|uniref:Methyltransferase FkbM domain-containing protein n=1 Tax=Tegillarca granosa TaxID=220873 RepID=A0ABQ9EMR0_TEGGR|nr:hypothetical protein KUTeg_018455 [Tegillarca granosa]
MCKSLAIEPTAQFIDIGANLGVIALSVAKCGKHVIIVEPLHSNIKRLCNSVLDGNFTDQITILHTAMSYQRKNVKLGNFGNQGCSFVVDKNDSKQKKPLLKETVMTATLDDILDLPGFINRKTFIKIDTEGHEFKVLDKGRKFFETVDIYFRISDKWIYDPSLCPRSQKFPKTVLRTPAGNTPIYIYELKEDTGVSSIVRSAGTFQPEVSELMCKSLAIEPTAQFIDIGANLGVIALSVAKCGKHVIIVEPLHSNIKRLCNSVLDGNFTDQVTILHTAMSNERKNVKLGNFGNQGCSFVVDKNDSKQKKPLFKETVMTATLDDILDLPGFINRKTFIKIDTEGHEFKVLDKGRKFFETVDVRGVLVEWILFKNQDTRWEIIKFFKERNFTPINFQTLEKLSENASHTWPHDVFWKPNA